MDFFQVQRLIMKGRWMQMSHVRASFGEKDPWPSLTLAMLRLLLFKAQEHTDFEKYLNPVMLVFIG